MKSQSHLILLDVADAVMLRELQRMIGQVIPQTVVKQKGAADDLAALLASEAWRRVSLIHDRQQPPNIAALRAAGITQLIILSGTTPLTSDDSLTIHHLKKPLRIQSLMMLLG